MRPKVTDELVLDQVTDPISAGTPTCSAIHVLRALAQISIRLFQRCAKQTSTGQGDKGVPNTTSVVAFVSSAGPWTGSLDSAGCTLNLPAHSPWGADRKTLKN
jgi:hypothetical protein